MDQRVSAKLSQAIHNLMPTCKAGVPIPWVLVTLDDPGGDPEVFTNIKDRKLIGTYLLAVAGSLMTDTNPAPDETIAVNNPPSQN
jgi:hypothetical protein